MAWQRAQDHDGLLEGPMSEPIKPALTAEKWAEWQSTWSHTTGEMYSTGPHRAAALALYGQPFGFTREDVRMLRNLGNSLLGSQHAYADGEAYLNLADRIEALLPPATK